MRVTFTFNVLHTEHNYIDLLQATLQVFLTWWMVNGMWDYIDNSWLMAHGHLLWLTFSPNVSNSFHIRERLLQRHFSIFKSAFSIFCPHLRHVGIIDEVSDCFFLLCHSLILSGSCSDHGEIPWNDYKRKQEWRCPFSAKGPWGIKAR